MNKNALKYIPSVSLRQDRRYKVKRQGKEDAFYVKLFIYYNGKKIAYSSDYALSDSDWIKIKSNQRKSPQFMEISRKLKEFKTKAEDIIKTLGDDFSFEKFDLLFMGDKSKINDYNDIFEGFRKYIKLNEEVHVSTATNYKTTLNSLLKYTQKDKLKYSEITPEFLREYENYLSKSHTVATISIYMRNIRAIYNIAIKQSWANESLYPFVRPKDDVKSTKFRITEDNSVCSKRQLSIKDIRKIMNYEPDNDADREALEMWKLSFYGEGMNFADIYRLKNKDLHEEWFSYTRQKTESTKKTVESKIIYLTPEMHDIIERWRSGNRDPEDYVFDLYTSDMTLKEQKRIRALRLGVINDRVSKIANSLGIQGRVTTYCARHGWGTVLSKKGVSISYIQKGYGHSSENTTRKYLGAYDLEEKKEANDILRNSLK